MSGAVLEARNKGRRTLIGINAMSISTADPLGLSGEKEEIKVDEQQNDSESNGFDQLERDFQKVMEELVDDKSLEYFRLEYEKLQRALQQSRDGEKRLIKKCRDANLETFADVSKVQTALKLSQENQSTIVALEKEIERAWKIIEASQYKEQKAKETVKDLKVEISLLSRLVEQGAGLSINQEGTVIDLLRQKGTLVKERVVLNESVEKLSALNAELFDKVQHLEKARSQDEAKIERIEKLLVTKENEVVFERRRKNRLEKELKELRETLKLTKHEGTQIQEENEKEQQRSSPKHLQNIEAELQQKLSQKISNSDSSDSQLLLKKLKHNLPHLLSVDSESCFKEHTEKKNNITDDNAISDREVGWWSEAEEIYRRRKETNK